MRIIFADDHEMILDALKNVIQSHFQNANIYTALNKNELFIQLKTAAKITKKKNNFDVLIQDVKFGEHNANDFIKDIKTDYPKLKILVLSSVSDKVSILKILKHVNGYVLKSDSVEEIIKGIETICNGEQFVSSKAETIIGQLMDSDTIILTRREREVLTEIMNEKSTKEIAECLFISSKTVEMHRSNLFIKLNVKNLTGLIKQVIAQNLLD